MHDNMEETVKMAVGGDRDALEQLIGSVKDRIYNLSLRMLWNPSDAEDATQEILIRVLTNLSKFRGESKFQTWVYRIASNHLINMQKRGMEHLNLSFEEYERETEAKVAEKASGSFSGVDREILAEELKISCTHAMLLCLDRESRLIYILSSMFGVNSSEGGEITGLSPEAYRKRLSRIRARMRSFMENNCGLVNPDVTCHCNKRVEIAIESHRINPEQLLFVHHPTISREDVLNCTQEMERLDKASAVFASNPYYPAPGKLLKNIMELFDSNQYQILEI